MPTIMPSSSFELIGNNHFFINLFSSKETRKYTVIVRHDGSGITNSREFTFKSTAGNPYDSNEDISSVFAYLYFKKSYNRNSYTVFINGLDCQGNIADTKSFQIWYTPYLSLYQNPTPCTFCE